MRLLTIASRRFAPATQRTVVLLSHEWHGIPDEHVDAADLYVEIPMDDEGATLNVAIAGSLVSTDSPACHDAADPACRFDRFPTLSSGSGRRSLSVAQVHAVVATLADWSVVDAIQ